MFPVVVIPCVTGNDIDNRGFRMPVQGFLIDIFCGFGIDSFTIKGYHVRFVIRIKQTVDAHPTTTADGSLFRLFVGLYPSIRGTDVVGWMHAVGIILRHLQACREIWLRGFPRRLLLGRHPLCRELQKSFCKKHQCNAADLQFLGECILR